MTLDGDLVLRMTAFETGLASVLHPGDHQGQWHDPTTFEAGQDHLTAEMREEAWMIVARTDETNGEMTGETTATWVTTPDDRPQLGSSCLQTRSPFTRQETPRGSLRPLRQHRGETTEPIRTRLLAPGHYRDRRLVSPPRRKVRNAPCGTPRHLPQWHARHHEDQQLSGNHQLVRETADSRANHHLHHLRPEQVAHHRRQGLLSRRQPLQIDMICLARRFHRPVLVVILPHAAVRHSEADAARAPAAGARTYRIEAYSSQHRGHRRRVRQYHQCTARRAAPAGPSRSSKTLAHLHQYLVRNHLILPRGQPPTRTAA